MFFPKHLDLGLTHRKNENKFDKILKENANSITAINHAMSIDTYSIFQFIHYHVTEDEKSKKMADKGYNIQLLVKHTPQSITCESRYFLLLVTMLVCFPLSKSVN